ncbi:MAG: PEP-utilizing enzyme, partial [Anaerolineae bacterium]
RHYGAPQDIEWCRAGDRFFIVQTRPITALPPMSAKLDVPGDDDWPVMEKKPAQPFDVWTQTNVGEVWPHPVSPLLWSAVTLTLNQSTRFALRDLRAPYLDDIQWTNRFYGRVYFNEGALAHIFNQEFGLPGSFIDAAFGTRGSADVRHPGGFHLLRFLRRLPAFLRMTVGRMGTDRELEAMFPQIDRWVDDFAARNPDELSDSVLWDELATTWAPRSSRVMNLHTAVSASAFASFSLLERLLGRWTGRGELAQDLVTGLSGVYTAQIGAALWEMACELRALGLADVVLDNSPEDALVQLQMMPEARPMIDRLNDFLQRHGHRCANEAEWLNPRWAEEPAQVIEVVAGYLKAGDRINPVEAEKRQRQRREEAVTWVEARLDPVRRAIFRGILARTQHLTRLRDNGKHYSMKAGFPFVLIYRTLGRRWTDRDWLDQPDDIFFLTVPDVERIIAAGDPVSAGLDLHTLTAERRKAFEYWFDVEVPEVIGPNGRPLDQSVETSHAGETTGPVLQGIAASGGQARGTARIIRSPDEMHKLQQGDILVTRATDPGWTPVFPIVGGLVLEVGGQLSHGAIVAREYGVPAVVNVNNAMQRITDGEEITVDGSAGCVYLDGQPGETPKAYNPETGDWNASLTGDFLWSNVNFGEAVTDVMTPLSWTVLQLIFGEWAILPGYHTTGNIW